MPDLHICPIQIKKDTKLFLVWCNFFIIIILLIIKDKWVLLVITVFLHNIILLKRIKKDFWGTIIFSLHFGALPHLSAADRQRCDYITTLFHNSKMDA